MKFPNPITHRRQHGTRNSQIADTTIASKPHLMFEVSVFVLARPIVRGLGVGLS